MEMTGSKRIRVYAAVILGNAFWGLSNAVTKIGVSVADPEILLTCRFLAAFIILTVMMLIRGEKLHFRRFPYREPGRLTGLYTSGKNLVSVSCLHRDLYSDSAD